jgi:hypothetical protein
MCVDYTDLYKHCPKDPFELLRIDQVIDSTAGCDLLCFLVCYFEYHQIAIKEEDQEKAAFITKFGAYCYTTMLFGLKNVGATYQRAIRPTSRSNSTRTSKPTWMTWSSRPEIPTRLSPILKRLSHLREYQWKLNANKCVFSVPSGNYSASSSAIAASKPTLRRSPPSPT